MEQFYELRLELTVAAADQWHAALYLTDANGQWGLAADWTVEAITERERAIRAVSDLVEEWFDYTGHLVTS